MTETPYRDAPDRPHVNKRLLFWAASAVTVALTFIGAELLLRLAWDNELDRRTVGDTYNDHVRLHAPNLHRTYNIAGMYDGADRSLFRTGGDGHILGAPNRGEPVAHFYGGSTTEARYVNEGGRWPELIKSVSARNYAMSGGSTLDGYYNFKFHLTSAAKPAQAFFMEAVNDFSLRDSMSSMQRYRARFPDRSTNTATTGVRSYTIDFGQNVYSALTTDNRVAERYRRSKRELDERVAEHYRKSKRELDERAFPFMTADQLRTYQRTDIEPFLRFRSIVFAEIARLARQHGVKVFLVTQPNAYRDDYIPFEEDWREVAEIRTSATTGYRLTMEQSRWLMAQINEHTKASGQSLCLDVLDVAAAFDQQPPSPLFYDAFHLTEKGSRFFASTINTLQDAGTQPGC